MKKTTEKSAVYDLFAEIDIESGLGVAPSQDTQDTQDTQGAKTEPAVQSGQAMRQASEITSDVFSSPAKYDGRTSRNRTKPPSKVRTKMGDSDCLINVEFSKITTADNDLENVFFSEKSVKAIIEADINVAHIEDFTQLYPLKVTRDGKNYRLVLNSPLFELLRIIGYSGNVFVDLVKPSIAEKYRDDVLPLLSITRL